jgi:hypothetical protein
MDADRSSQSDEDVWKGAGGSTLLGCRWLRFETVTKTPTAASTGRWNGKAAHAPCNCDRGPSPNSRLCAVIQLVRATRVLSSSLVRPEGLTPLTVGLRPRGVETGLALGVVAVETWCSCGWRSPKSARISWNTESKPNSFRRYLWSGLATLVGALSE